MSGAGNSLLIAFDKFKGTMTSADVNETCQYKAKQILGAHYPVKIQGLSDGGDGFINELTRYWGSKETLEVTDLLLSQRPRGRDETSSEVEYQKRRFNIGFVPARQLNQTLKDNYNLKDNQTIGIVESAQAIGLASLDPTDRHPYHTSTANVGQAITFLNKFRVDVILVGLGGSSTNDLGLGCLQQLGARFFTKDGVELFDIRPRDFHKVEKIDTTELESLPRLIVASDVDNPLLGPLGCTRQFAPQKGLRDTEVDDAELQINRMASLLASATKKSFGVVNDFGMGAAGGLGCGLKFAYDAEIVKGFYIFSDWVQFQDNIDHSSWIVTGEGRFDQTSLTGKGPAEVLRFGASKNKKLALVCGSIESAALKKIQKEIDQPVEAFQLSKTGDVLSVEKSVKRLFTAMDEITQMMRAN